jgi:hypothetical protein
MQSSIAKHGRPEGVAGPILVVFVDGVGIAPDRPGNPFVDRPLAGFRRLVGGSLAQGCERVEPARVVAAVDATLGVDGLPQSGTGQTTLFTGVNAARALGRHVPAMPGPRLRAIIEAEGLLAKALAAGSTVALANAFNPAYLAALDSGERRPSVTVHLARSAGVPLRAEAELVRNQAVSWDIERDLYRRAVGDHVPAVAAAAAGRHLAELATSHQLTLYETFLTDLAGHGRVPVPVLEAIDRVDALIDGLLEALPGEVTVVLCSDHGNVEEPEHPRHTRNPVPLVAIGPRAACFAGVRSIDELTPAVLCALGGACGSVETVAARETPEREPSSRERSLQVGGTVAGAVVPVSAARESFGR